jgi:hypothetical protein
MQEAAMRQRYSSDISLEQFSMIGALLERVWRKTRLCTVDLYEVLCGRADRVFVVPSYSIQGREGVGR